MKISDFRFQIANIFVLCILQFAFCVSSFAADVANTKVVSSITPTEIRIGERIEFKVLISHDKGIDLFYPDESAQLSPFEVLKHKVIARSGGQTELVYTITTFDAGEFVVPPVLVTAKDRFGNEKNIRTVEHRVAVKTGAAVGNEILDIIPPMDVTERQRYLQRIFSWLPYIVPFLSALAVVIYLLTQRREAASLPVVDPRERALDRLRKVMIDEGRIRTAYFEIDGVIRTFLGEHIRIEAMKMTSGEITALLAGDDRMEKKTLRGASDLFFDLDLVKFSPFKPSGQDASEAVARAERIVKEVP